MSKTHDRDFMDRWMAWHERKWKGEPVRWDDFLLLLEWVGKMRRDEWICELHDDGPLPYGAVQADRDHIRAIVAADRAPDEAAAKHRDEGAER